MNGEYEMRIVFEKLRSISTSNKESLDKGAAATFGFSLDAGAEEPRGDVRWRRFARRLTAGFRRWHRKQVAGSRIGLVREVTHLGRRLKQLLSIMLLSGLVNHQ